MSPDDVFERFEPFETFDVLDIVREVDALIDRLDQACSDERDEPGLPGHRLAAETRQLHARLLRQSASELVAVDRAARSVVAGALDRAEALRAAALAGLAGRLDESDRLMSTTREGFRVELRAAELARVSPDRCASGAG